ncbi:MAG: hypothetical protein V4690_01040 [Patescibacteria group bacterium]
MAIPIFSIILGIITLTKLLSSIVYGITSIFYKDTTKKDASIKHCKKLFWDFLIAGILTGIAIACETWMIRRMF